MLQEVHRFNEAQQCWSEAAGAFIEAGDSERAASARLAVQAISSPGTEE